MELSLLALVLLPTEHLGHPEVLTFDLDLQVVNKTAFASVHLTCDNQIN